MTAGTGEGVLGSPEQWLITPHAAPEIKASDCPTTLFLQSPLVFKKLNKTPIFKKRIASYYLDFQAFDCLLKKVSTKSWFVSKDVGLAFNTSSVTKAQAVYQPQQSLG